MNECFAPMQQSKSGKSPGMDGLPLEFYRTFWRVLEEDFVLVANEILQFGRHSGSQQKGVIRLFYKRGDCRDLANWHPISLLNADYKIITNDKALANRLKLVLPNIIHS